MLEPILANYKLSVTHLNNFIDVTAGGPQFFLVHNLLRFPQALTPPAAYGDSVHKALQWANSILRETGRLPSKRSLQTYFTDMLDRKHLKQTDYKRLAQRGQEALGRYLKDRRSSFSAQDLIERGFNNEGAIVNSARLSGKIDKMHFTGVGRLQVIDFKTGPPAKSWQAKADYEKVKLHKYRQQLLFYKLLVEQSASFSKKLNVESGTLEFIEPDSEGALVDNLNMSFDSGELQKFRKLIGIVWQHIMALNFPDIHAYPKNLAGITQFEDDLLTGKI